MAEINFCINQFLFSNEFQKAGILTTFLLACEVVARVR